MKKIQSFPSDLADKFMLRMPSGMRDRISEIAKHNNRSMNAEIVAALERAYPAPRPVSDGDTMGVVDMRKQEIWEIMQEMDRLRGRLENLYSGPLLS